MRFQFSLRSHVIGFNFLQDSKHPPGYLSNIYFCIFLKLKEISFRAEWTHWTIIDCQESPDQEAGDDWEQDAGDQLEHAVEPDAHLVQNVVISRQLE